MKNEVVLILGNITFLNIQNDGEHKAIVHSIQSVRKYATEEEASIVGEEMLNEYESYLVPSVYNGVIDLTDLDCKE